MSDPYYLYEPRQQLYNQPNDDNNAKLGTKNKTNTTINTNTETNTITKQIIKLHTNSKVSTPNT